MNVADWFIVGVVVLSAMVAASQGFFFELLSLAGTVVGYLLASWQYKRVGGWLQPYLTSTYVAAIAGFLIIFVAVVILAGVLARLTRWFMKEAGLSWFDRILGAMFGVVRGGLIVAVVLMVMTSFTPSSRFLTGSELAPYFLVVGRAAIWLAPSELRGHFYQGLDLLRHAHQEPERTPGSK